MVLSSYPSGFSRTVGVTLPLLLSFVFRRLLLRFQRFVYMLGRFVSFPVGVYGNLCFVRFGRLCLIFQCIGVFKAETIASRFLVERNVPFIGVSLSVFEIRNIKGLALGELLILFIGERFATVLFRVVFLCLFGCFITKEKLCIFFIGIELYMSIFVRTVFKIQPLQINGFPIFQIPFLVFGQFYALNLIGYFYPVLPECDDLIREVVDTDNGWYLFACFGVGQFHHTPHVSGFEQVFPVFFAKLVTKERGFEIGFVAYTVHHKYRLSIRTALKTEPCIRTENYRI